MAKVPQLPDDVLRALWQRVWRVEAAERVQCAVRAWMQRRARAACVIQRAVRVCIARAAGDPWDMPGLSDDDDDDDVHNPWIVPYNVWVWHWHAYAVWHMDEPEMQDVD